MDLNGDGHLDILTGSWPGELFLFRGGLGGEFAPPEMIKNKEGDFINIGGGIRKQSNGSILVTGDARFEHTEEGTFVNYHGRRIESTPEKPVSITGAASAAHAVDWDGDGDFDLLVGDIGGNVYLVPNEGTTKAYAFGKESQLTAGGKPLRVVRDAGPFVADWDGDGDRDLLVGAVDGSVLLFRNEADGDAAPKLAAAEILVPKAKFFNGSDAPTEPRRGVRSKVCAADWNGDGRLDLLVGDWAIQKSVLPKPTPEQKAEQEELRKTIDKLAPRYMELNKELYGDSRVKEKKERFKLLTELEEVDKELTKAQREQPQEYESHGWVWLFIRQ